MSAEKVVAQPSSVTPFPGASVPRVGCVPEIVEKLEIALSQAKDGSLVAIAIVKVKRQPMGFSIDHHTEPGSSHSLAAGVMAQHHRIASYLINDDDED